MKRFMVGLGTIAVCAAVVCGAEHGSVVPEKITLGALANLHPAVEYDHAAHAEIAGDCASCHHQPFGEPAPCATCHEDGGRVQEDESPRLAGQWAAYTRYALETCRAEGKRCTPRKMGERVMKLSDEELEALAQYYESQK